MLAYVGLIHNLKDLKESYRGTSLLRKRTALGAYRKPMPRVPGGS